MEHARQTLVSESEFRMQYINQGKRGYGKFQQLASTLAFFSLMDFFKYNWSPCETHDECYVSLLCVNCLLNRSFSWLRDALSFTLMVLKGERDSDWKIHVSIIFWPRRTPLYPFWSTFSQQSLSRSQLENDVASIRKNVFQPSVLQNLARPSYGTDPNLNVK